MGVWRGWGEVTEGWGCRRIDGGVEGVGEVTEGWGG